jgi:hypothetical protein
VLSVLSFWTGLSLSFVILFYGLYLIIICCLTVTNFHPSYLYLVPPPCTPPNLPSLHPPYLQPHAEVKSIAVCVVYAHLDGCAYSKERVEVCIEDEEEEREEALKLGMVRSTTQPTPST